MGNLFNMDNGVFTFLGKVFDIMILSFIYLLFCIPIVTIGPATTALYYTVVKVIRKNRGYVFREFFKSFRENFKVGAIAGTILVLLGLLLFVNLRVTKGMNTTMASVLSYMYLSGEFLLLCTGIYLFPVLSRFQLGVVQLFKTSFLLAVKHLPTTFLLVVLAIVTALGSYMTILLTLFAPALFYLVASFLLERIFKKYTPKEEEDSEHPRKDEWYLE